MRNRQRLGFIGHYTDKDGCSVPFERKGTRVRKQAKLGRNKPCHCGSGRKFKNCCMQYQSNEDIYEVLG